MDYAILTELGRSLGENQRRLEAARARDGMLVVEGVASDQHQFTAALELRHLIAQLDTPVGQGIVLAGFCAGYDRYQEGGHDEAH